MDPVIEVLSTAAVGVLIVTGIVVTVLNLFLTRGDK